MFDFGIISFGLGAIVFYFMMKVLTNNCKNELPAIENNIQDNQDENDTEVPPKYEELYN